MHKVTIPESITDRGKRLRGGREHVFDTLDMSKVVHVIVDLQVGFCAEGAPIEVPTTRAIFGNVNAITCAVRAGDGTNVFLRCTYGPEEPTPWNVWFESDMSPDQSAATQAVFRRGEPNWQLMPDLEVEAEDLIIDKTSFSTLIPGTSKTDATLKARGIDTLIITGTLTSCCCENTTRDALQMGYNIIFMTDAHATLTDEEHNGTLMSMCAIFADVRDKPSLLAMIEESSMGRAAA